MSHTEEDLEEDDELANSDIREAYKQNSNNMRAFMVLRFRHFATFSVIMAFVTTAVFQIADLKDYKLYVVVFGMITTVLFWLLDYRTGEYLKYHAMIAKSIEGEYFRRESRIELNTAAFPTPKYLSASIITNLIFSLILIGWAGFVIAIQPENRDPEQPQTGAAATIPNTTPPSLRNRIKLQRGP